MSPVPPPDAYIGDQNDVVRAVAKTLAAAPDQLGHVLVLVQGEVDDGQWDALMCCDETRERLPEILRAIADAYEARSRAALS